MYCIDNPEDLIFFGSATTIVASYYELLLVECNPHKSKKCALQTERQSKISSNDYFLTTLINNESYQTN